MGTSIEEIVRLEELGKIGVVIGSINELHEVVAKKGCNGDVRALAKALPGEHVFCFHKKHNVPLVLATAVTPYHTGRDMKIDGDMICEMDCQRACKHAMPVIQ